MLSIYGTIYNNAGVLQESLERLGKQLDKISADYELVICDNFSTDGSWEILKENQDRYNIRLIREKCSRGKGRQIALSQCNGKVVSYVDFDSLATENLAKIILYLIEENPDILTNSIINRTCHKETLTKIGGWYDLNCSEDTELLARAIAKGVNISHIPVLTEDNEIAKHREMRYLSTGYRRYIKRELKWHMDRVRGNGCDSFTKILPHRFDQALIDSFVLVLSKVKGYSIYPYSHTNNKNFVLRNTKFIRGPEQIKTTQFIGFHYLPLLSKNTLAEITRKYSFIGLDQHEAYRKNIIFHAADTDKRLIRNTKIFLSGESKLSAA